MKIKNRKVFFNYKILDRFEAGISLTGGEAKAASMGQINLSNAYVKIINNEAFLIGATINIKGAKDYDPTRTRKLLLKKKEIISINSVIKGKNLTIVPLSMYNTRRLIKVEIALAKSKKKHQKRDVIKERDIKIDAERELKEALD